MYCRPFYLVCHAIFCGVSDDEDAGLHAKERGNHEIYEQVRGRAKGMKSWLWRGKEGIVVNNRWSDVLRELGRNRKRNNFPVEFLSVGILNDVVKAINIFLWNYFIHKRHCLLESNHPDCDFDCFFPSDWCIYFCLHFLHEELLECLTFSWVFLMI